MEAFTIGHVARATGCKVQTIRYYEQIGLLPRPDRSEGNQRLYVRSDIDRLLVHPPRPRPRLLDRGDPRAAAHG